MHRYLDKGIDFSNRDIISITDLSRDEILYLCEIAADLWEREKSEQRNALRDELKGKTLAYMFFEDSTRTRTSFNTAMRELGGSRDGFSGKEGTSLQKKESVRDTLMMYWANHADIIVMRHPNDGSVQWAADVVGIPVINGGDGKNEHPTQALLDLFSLYLGNDQSLDNIRVGFGGDLAHGRTVHSLSLGLSHFQNPQIYWATEDALGMPKDLEQLLESKGVKVFREKTVQDVLSKVDPYSYYMTRPQLERMKGITQAQIEELLKKYRITKETLRDHAAKLLHPLPVNSELAEIEISAYYTKNQGFFRQAENGVLLRKALLWSILQTESYTPFSGYLHPDLEHGNNRLVRHKTGKRKAGKFIDDIHSGISIDHVARGYARLIADKLQLSERGYSSAPIDMEPKDDKSFVKSSLDTLTERELKQIALISPEATINIIKGGKVVEKFVYLLCQNDNCITRVVTEDVPPKFYHDGTIRCRYCRKPYAFEGRKIQPKEKEAFIAGLPKVIVPIVY
ncbi:aspartate carbamoyltransferase [Candidatus Woesearchaeota archaeon]|nr:MAG: aspartate carbamoyltransferase [Candidatus Woesearchaeota archaeon]